MGVDEDQGEWRATADREKGNTVDLTTDNHAATGPIDLTQSDDEEEDEDLKRAIALSLQDQQPVVPAASTSKETESLPTSSLDIADIQESTLREQSTQTMSGGSSMLLGLDRKQMEAERLARLKRKREPETQTRAISPPSLQRQLGQSLPVSTSRPTTAKKESSCTPGRDSEQEASLEYPHGKIFLTSLAQQDHRFISFSDILKLSVGRTPLRLKSAFLSTFIFDFDWLFPHFDTRNVSFVLALHARDGQQKIDLQEDFADIPNVRLTFPHVGGIVNCMHSKVMLLFYEHLSPTNSIDRVSTACRIAIPSANLVPWDWGVGGVMENIVFVIDLPPLNDGLPTPSEAVNGFKSSLMRMLKEMGTPDDVMRKLDTFDFTHTAPCGFIHTIGGSHTLVAPAAAPKIRELFSKPIENKASTTPDPQSTMIRTGLAALSDAVRSLNLNISEGDTAFPPRLDYITSSMGALKRSFLENLALAACGYQTFSKARPKLNPMARGATSKSNQKPETGTTGYIENMTVYFPSEATVRNSKGGLNAAGTICFQSKWWDATNGEFPRTRLRDCVGVRHDRILMHSKILFLRFAAPKSVWKDSDPHPSRPQRSTSGSSGETIVPLKNHPASAVRQYVGWVYVGSANLSESAWGSVVTDSKTKQPKLSCRNWESGVLIPVPLNPEHENKKPHELTLEQVFGHVVPVPIEYPGVAMVDSGRRPWFFNG